MRFMKKLILLLASYWIAVTVFFPLLTIVAVVIALLFFEPGIGDVMLLALGCFVAVIAAVASGQLRATAIEPGDQSNGIEIEL